MKAEVELDEAIRSGTVEREEIQRVYVSGYAIRWQERKAREGLADSTIKSRADILVDHVLPFLGWYGVRRITRGDLLEWRDDALGARKKAGGA